VKRGWLAAGLIATIGLTGCGAVAQTAPDEVALRYSGTDIALEAEKFVACYGPSDVDRGGLGDKVYNYPAGQRTFKFSNDPGSDAPPLAITAQGGVTMSVSGVITFVPKFEDCDKLRTFHEQIGRKFGAYTRGEDDYTTAVVESLSGWTSMLNTYVKGPVDKAVDNAALPFTWDKLAGDPESKRLWEEAALAEIPKIMRQQQGLGPNDVTGEFFTVQSIVLQRPEIPPNLQAGIEQSERARLNAAAAEIDKQAAAGWPGGPEAYTSYQQSQAVNQAIRDGKVQVIPIPAGSPVQVAVPVAPR
jgi:hypothetical protein